MDMSTHSVKNVFQYIISAGLLAFSWIPIWASADQLYMVSQPGDYIGQGLETNIDNTSHTFTAQRNYDNGISVRVNGSTWWYLDFAAPGDMELTPGVYEGAVRWPFQSITQPGLSVSGNGRGCNTLTGQFTVLEVLYNADGTIGQLAADFEQHCEGAQPGLFGAIRFNSDAPIDVSIPAVFAKAGDDQFVMDLQPVTLDGSSSYTSDGSVITGYYWSQIGGPAVYLDDPTSASPSFTAPIASLGGVDLEFELEVTSSSGAMATDVVAVSVSSKSDPQTFITMNSDVGDYIGQGQQYFLGLSHGTFTATSNNADHARMLFRGQYTWTFEFAAPAGSGLTAQDYWNATRYPFQNPTVPGLSVSGAGRGCNTLTGNFTVLELAKDANNAIESMAVDFEQHCEGQAPALFGSVRYNYVDPSVPVADAGEDQTALSGQAVTLNGSLSSDSDGQIGIYQWSQVSGIPVVLQGSDTVAPMFTSPSVPLGSTEVLTFELLVTDNLGYMSKDTVTVSVEGVNQISYCEARGQNTYYEWIDGINIGSDNRVSGNNQGYADFSAYQAIQLTRGINAVELIPGFGSGSYREHWSVWVDLNQDGQFSADELLLRTSSRTAVIGSIVIPDTALSGATRMRISMRYNAKAEPCGVFYYGEVEDYTVLIP